MAGGGFRAKPVFAKHRQREEYDHYLSHQLNVQISREFPPGRSYTVRELTLVQKSQKLKDGQLVRVTNPEASQRSWTAMIGKHLYPIMPCIQTGVACRGLCLFKVHVYIEILLHVCFSERSVCGCGNDVVSAVAAKSTLIAKSKKRDRNTERRVPKINAVSVGWRGTEKQRFHMADYMKVRKKTLT